MKEGAVAMIDALGFRGIWQRWPAGTVLADMHALKDRLEQDVREVAKQPELPLEVTFLSDTIVLGLAVPTNIAEHAALSVVYAADIVTRVLAWTAQSARPLAYRGAIAYGQYLLTQHFVIGAAVDEAAQHHEAADAAIVWLLPSALDAIRERLQREPDNTHLVPHDVPLKTRGKFNSYTVSPIIQAASECDAREMAKKILATFQSGGTNAVDIAIKRRNTLGHLQSCFLRRQWRLPEGFDFP